MYMILNKFNHLQDLYRSNTWKVGKTTGFSNSDLATLQICETIGCSINEFSKVYNQVIKDFPHLKSEALSVEELTEYVLKSLKMDDSERQSLVERTIELIRIVRKCWLIEGRSPPHIIYAAAYLSWKSLKPSVRTKAKLTEFCDTVGLDYKHTTSKRVNDFLQTLRNLGQKIPGKEKFRFNQNNIAIYIEDILQYSHSLLYDLSSEASKRFKAMSNTSESAFDSTYFRKLKSSAKRQKESNLTPIDGQTDEEISDSEINCYIRSDVEVKKIKKLKKFIDLEEVEENEEDRDQMVKHIDIEDLNKLF